MSLKCPICGKKYFHDRKICKACENKSINSGLVMNEDNFSQKWNCSMFLEFDTLAFGKHSPDNTHIKIASEPKYSDFKPKREYIWNCSSNSRFKKFFPFKEGVFQLKESTKIPITSLRIISKDINNSLIYE